MMQDISVLVAEQGDTLNSVERNVETASKYVERGNEQLASALRRKRRWRQCYCCAAVCGTVLLAVGIAALVLFLNGAYKKFVP